MNAEHALEVTRVTADLHFGHGMVAGLRGFDDVAEHDEMLVERWNAGADRDTLTWVLGDFSFADAEFNRKVFAALAGRKALVVGNHDPRHVIDLPWSEVHTLVRRRFGGRSYVLCHYPLLTWRNAQHGSYHLHGHCHGNLHTAPTTRLDVGIDCHPDRAPFRMAEVARILATRTYDPVDHHEQTATV